MYHLNGLYDEMNEIDESLQTSNYFFYFDETNKLKKKTIQLNESILPNILCNMISLSFRAANVAEML